MRPHDFFVLWRDSTPFLRFAYSALGIELGWRAAVELYHGDDWFTITQRIPLELRYPRQLRFL